MIWYNLTKIWLLLKKRLWHWLSAILMSHSAQWVYSHKSWKLATSIENCKTGFWKLEIDSFLARLALVNLCTIVMWRSLFSCAIEPLWVDLWWRNQTVCNMLSNRPKNALEFNVLFLIIQEESQQCYESFPWWTN